VVLFGTPPAEPHLAEGFYHESATPQGDRFSWARQEAELSLSWPVVAPRAALIDVAPPPGLSGQSADVSLNGAPLTRLVLGDQRQRYRLELPAAAQRVGDNRLRFVFGAATTPSEASGGERRRLAAAFYSLVVGDAGDDALLDLLARGAPAPFSVADEAGVPCLSQVGPSVVRYALRMPVGAELRFTPRAHPRALAAGGAVSFRVTVESEAGGEKELWGRVLDLASARAAGEEVRLKLPGSAGDVVRLGLHVGGAAAGRFAWGTWVAPRVMGKPEPDALRPPSPEPGVQRRVAELRASLGNANVLLIVLDAARAQQFGTYGYARATTPEIDRIAAEGVVFERAYTPAVYTLGAMSSVWTSQYPDRHHAEVSYADRLPADRLTLAEVLSARGIHTVGFVANPMAGTAFGFERGFLEYKEVFTWYPELGSRAEAFSRILPPWLAKHREGRFFAYLHFREPHFPYDPPAPFPTTFGPDAPLTVEQRRGRDWYQAINAEKLRPSPDQVAHLVRLYDGNLAYADRQVGVLRRALEGNGLWERTVVIVAADHGEQLYEKGYISHSAQVYEQSTRIPLVLRLPGTQAPRGIRVRALVDLLDLAPTVLEVFGLGDARTAREFQGGSLLAAALGGSGKPAVLSRTVWDRPVYALRDDRYKLVYETRTGAQRLFDLEADPGESRDRQAERPLLAALYRQELQDWVARLSTRASAPAVGAGQLTREQCEHMRGLGYVVADCP
jgi:arylsulfatase A-like enzyme